MSDIRARLADALMVHRSSPTRFCSGCDWDGTGRTESTLHDEAHLVDALLSLSGIAIVDVDQFRRQITEELNAKYRDGTITAADEFAAMKVNRLLDSASAAAVQAQEADPG